MYIVRSTEYGVGITSRHADRRATYYIWPITKAPVPIPFIRLGWGIAQAWKLCFADFQQTLKDQSCNQTNY